MKKVGIVVLLSVFVGLGWYFFVKAGEFSVSFKAKTLPGDIIQSLAIWNKSLTPSEELQIDSLSTVTQLMNVENRHYNYIWELDRLNDSTTSVRVSISQPNRQLLNKLLVPFSSQPIEKDAERLVREFYKVVQEHLKITRVNVEGIDTLDSRFCVCLPLKTKQTDKANGMMSTYNFLVSYIEDNSLEVAGKPMIDIQSWDHNLGQLEFDFCFPIRESDSLPSDPSFFYKSIGLQKALKANFYGNYITSDRAWYYLKDYAASHNLEVVGLPKEIFYNNPNMGIDETKWKAEVYLPVR